MLSALIAIVNHLSNFLVTDLIKNLHFGTKSLESNTMMVTNFVVTFMNTVVLLWFINANFSESEYWILREYFSEGKQTDLGPQWYKDIGPVLIGAQFIGAFIPTISFFIEYLKTKFFQWRDRGWTCDRKKTR